MVEPQVWSTAVIPMRAPRCSGSAAIVSTASDDALNSRSYCYERLARHRGLAVKIASFAGCFTRQSTANSSSWR
jgi:hypothetical protein